MPDHFDPEAWQRAPAGYLPADDAEEDLDPVSENLVNWILGLGPTEILDVGCCNGRYIRWLRQRGYGGEYVGLDVTPAFLEQARRRNPAETFLPADLTRDLPATGFSLVLAANVLMHLRDPLEPVGRLCEASTQYVILSVYASDRKIEWTHDEHFYNWWIPPALVGASFPAGWRIVRDRLVTPAWDTSRRLYQCIAEKTR